MQDVASPAGASPLLRAKREVSREELNEFLKTRLADDGFLGVEIRPLPKHTEIIIRITSTANAHRIVGKTRRRIDGLEADINERCGSPDVVFRFFLHVDAG